MRVLNFDSLFDVLFAAMICFVQQFNCTVRGICTSFASVLVISLLDQSSA